MKWLLIALVVALYGCSAPVKPSLTDDQYITAARITYANEYCAAKGMIDLDTAAAIKRTVQQRLATYSVDHNHYMREAMSIKQELTQSDCNTFALNAKTHLNLATKQAPVEIQVNQEPAMSRPSQTYCNRIGTQTLCSSY